MRPFKKLFSGAIAFAAALSVATATLAANISGAGATFPFPIYAKWAGAYKGVSGNSLNYQSIGSGGGIKQIESKTVTFGASDMSRRNAFTSRAVMRLIVPLSSRY